MSSDFEKSLARAAAVRSASDEAMAQHERGRADKANLARSIINPYLSELGPKAAKALMELGVPTERRYKIGGPKEGKVLGFWEFVCARDSDSGDEIIRLTPSGSFPAETKRRVGLIRKRQMVFMTEEYGRDAHLFANLDDKKIYISRKRLSQYSFNFDASQLQELGEFLAQAIYEKKA